MKKDGDQEGRRTEKKTLKTDHLFLPQPCHTAPSTPRKRATSPSEPLHPPAACKSAVSIARPSSHRAIRIRTP